MSTVSGRAARAVAHALASLLVVATTARAADEDAPTADAAPIRCLDAENLRVEPINDSLVVVHGSGNRMWISRLPQRCSGLSRAKLTISAPTLDLAPRICKGDSFHFGTAGVDAVDRQSCIFGNFEKVTPAQVEMLRRAEPAQ